MILLILLSIGAIYAVVPIVIIVILIVAARGSARGEDFFEIFGIQTFKNSFGGFSGNWSGKGIGKSSTYKSNTRKVKGAIGENIEGGGIYGNLWGYRSKLDKIEKSTMRSKIDAISGLTAAQLKALATYYGLGASANASVGTLAGLITANLTMDQINSYMNANKIKPGTIAPLQAPTGSVRMSVKNPSTLLAKGKTAAAATGEFYKTYYKTRKGNFNPLKPPLFRSSPEERAKGLNLDNQGAKALREQIVMQMDNEDLKGALKYWGIKNVPHDADRDTLMSQANASLSASQITNYLNQKNNPDIAIKGKIDLGTREIKLDKNIKFKRDLSETGSPNVGKKKEKKDSEESK